MVLRKPSKKTTCRILKLIAKNTFKYVTVFQWLKYILANVNAQDFHNMFNNTFRYSCLGIHFERLPTRTRIIDALRFSTK